jgi:hypothetical protein
MTKRHAWRIFYDDGSTFSDTDGTPEEAPALGFICALGYDEAGMRYIMHGWDHYQWDKESNQWWGMDLFGLIDRLTRNLVYAYKQGRTITKADFQAAMRRAHEDTDFPR